MALELKSDPEQKVRMVPVPYCTIYFEQGQPITFDVGNMEGIPLVMVERGSMMLLREVMKARQKAARTKPETHNAGWEQPEVKRVEA